MEFLCHKSRRTTCSFKKISEEEEVSQEEYVCGFPVYRQGLHLLKINVRYFGEKIRPSGPQLPFVSAGNHGFVAISPAYAAANRNHIQYPAAALAHKTAFISIAFSRFLSFELIGLEITIRRVNNYLLSISCSHIIPDD